MGLFYTRRWDCFTLSVINNTVISRSKIIHRNYYTGRDNSLRTKSLHFIKRSVRELINQQTRRNV